MVTRAAAVAGMFYPDNLDVLSRQIETYLSEVPEHDGPAPVGIIVPHAGYIYSGPVAASAYACLRGCSFHKVAVFAPSHFDAFEGLSIYSGDAMYTPLGEVEVAVEERERLCQEHGAISSDLGHGSEHALEVQLPFLQKVLEPGWQLIPIVMGLQNRETAKQATAIIREYLQSQILVVISSDLSHYYPYNTAKRIDGRFCKMIESGNLDELWTASRKREVEACGFGSVFALLSVVKERDNIVIEILDYRNSGDTAGSKDQVVGYCAAGVFERS
ncbi:MAG: AmmeMemoRadiSam system protein B [Candidatus Marinimicrobia bacterium]|nr:AmmeMemoRadiSam system protein B [Candidatus Neomarinimicrobiota bacterium]|tara:strand:+ start:2264 stop:3082 length:819 start_codon:yes stop_codon:yes gene_type:complete